MFFIFHEVKTFGKQFKIFFLCRLKFICLKERNDHIQEVFSFCYNVTKEIFFMIIMPSISMNTSDLKKVFQVFQTLQASRTLHNGKIVRDLIACLISSSNSC